MKYLVLALFMGISAEYSQNLADDSNISCARRLEIPLYPALADAARVSATVTAVVRVGPDGFAHEVHFDAGGGSTMQDLFVSSVKESLRASDFVDVCKGKIVRIQFEFALGDKVGSQRVVFGFPNHFTILAPAKIVQGDVTSKK